jgi:hypothetical protein
MRKILVHKNQKYGHFEYKFEGDKGFRIIPSWVDSKEKIIQWYTAGGHTGTHGQYDLPEVVFCNEKGIPAVHYRIKLNEMLAGHKFAMVDYDKQFLIEPDMFVPDAEKLEFLQDHSSVKMDQEASKLTTDQEKIMYYLNVIPDETKEIYKTFLNEKLTPDVIKEICTNNARTYSLPAEVEFIEK